MSHKEEKVREHLKDLAGEFLVRQSNRTSLITVTNLVLTPDMKRVEVLLSVLPIDKGRAAVEFANRNRNEFREYIKKHSRMRVLPSVHFSLDIGEQNRQRIDELLESDK